MDRPSLFEFVTDGQLLGLTVSPGQGTLLKAIEGEGLAGEELTMSAQCTGRATYRPSARRGHGGRGCPAGKGSRSRPRFCV